MKKPFLFLAVLIATTTGTEAFATIPSSAVSAYVAHLYGMYTTSDPTCQTDLIKTIPVTSTAIDIDVIKGAKFGDGPMATGIKCVVMVMKNTLSVTYAAGTYTTSTNGGSDNVCNAGGTVDAKICQDETPNFPAAISADITSAGLTPASSCPASPTGNEVIAVYVSTYSTCTGQSQTDTAGTTAGCYTNNAHPFTFQFPIAESSITKGVKLTAPADGAASRDFVINPDNTIGKQYTTCGSAAAPLFSFR